MEVALAIPVLLVFLAAVVEFGLILANLKYLPLASRAGAKVLAEVPAANLNDPATLVTVKAAVDAVLASANMGTSCRVILEHNYPPAGGYQETAAPCNCSAPTTPPLPTPALPGAPAAVRVTVCVSLSAFTPDLLPIVFPLAGRTFQSSTVYPYEDPH